MAVLGGDGNPRIVIVDWCLAALNWGLMNMCCGEASHLVSHCRQLLLDAMENVHDVEGCLPASLLGQGPLLWRRWGRRRRMNRIAGPRHTGDQCEPPRIRPKYGAGIQAGSQRAIQGEGPSC